jgi:hypothetical protein
MTVNCGNLSFRLRDMIHTRGDHKTAVVRDTTPCSLVYLHQLLWRIYRLQIHVWRTAVHILSGLRNSYYSLKLKLAIVLSSEMVLNFYLHTRCHVPTNSNLESLETPQICSTFNNKWSFINFSNFLYKSWLLPWRLWQSVVQGVP